MEPYGWRDGLVVKIICCSRRHSGFSFQNPRGGLQLAVTPVPGDPIPLSGLWVPGTHVRCRQTWRQSTLTKKYNMGRT